MVGGGGWRRQTRQCDYGGDGPVWWGVGGGGDRPDSVTMEGMALWRVGGGGCGGDGPDGLTMEGTTLWGGGWDKTDQMVLPWRGRPCGVGVGWDKTDQMVLPWRGRPCGERGGGRLRRQTRWCDYGGDGPDGVGGDRPDGVTMEGTALMEWEETDQMV